MAHSSTIFFPIAIELSATELLRRLMHNILRNENKFIKHLEEECRRRDPNAYHGMNGNTDATISFQALLISPALSLSECDRCKPRPERPLRWGGLFRVDRRGRTFPCTRCETSLFLGAGWDSGVLELIETQLYIEFRADSRFQAETRIVWHTIHTLLDTSMHLRVSSWLKIKHSGFHELFIYSLHFRLNCSR